MGKNTLQKKICILIFENIFAIVFRRKTRTEIAWLDRLNNYTQRKRTRMEESQRAKIEAKLKKMIELQTQSQKENKRVKNVPLGTKVIRRRKGSPDKHIIETS